MGMVPLPHEYMIAGIIGFLVSVFLIDDLTWSFALGLFFLLLVIASLVSISGSERDEESLDLIGGGPYMSKRRKHLGDKR